LGQRIAGLRHFWGLALLGKELLDDGAFVRLSWDDAESVGLGFLQQIRMAGHDVLAAGLGRLMAALAVLRKDGTNLPVIADLGRFCAATLGLIGGAKGGQCGAEGDKKGQRSKES